MPLKDNDVIDLEARSKVLKLLQTKGRTHGEEIASGNVFVEAVNGADVAEIQARAMPPLIDIHYGTPNHLPSANPAGLEYPGI